MHIIISITSLQTHQIGCILFCNIRRKSIQQLCLLILLGIVAVHDVTSHRIPNNIIFIGYCISFIFFLFQSGSKTLIPFVLNATIPYILIIFYALGQLGAGDVKLISVVTTFLGMKKTLWWLAYTIGLLGIYIVVLWTVRMRNNNILPCGLAMFLAMILLMLKDCLLHG